MICLSFVDVIMLFFFNDTATTEIYTAQYTLSLHDALPISCSPRAADVQFAIAVACAAVVVALAMRGVPRRVGAVRALGGVVTFCGVGYLWVLAMWLVARAARRDRMAG